jgi:hypothetical protein
MAKFTGITILHLNVVLRYAIYYRILDIYIIYMTQN